MPKESRSRDAAPTADESLDDVQGQIETLRDELTTLLSELDRRRHDALHLGGQVWRGSSWLTLLAAGAGAVYLTTSALRSRERARIEAERSQLREALLRVLAAGRSPKDP
jgi:hypothetical protein